MSLFSILVLVVIVLFVLWAIGKLR